MRATPSETTNAARGRARAVAVEHAIPTRIGRYRLEGELGRGGMARVYRAVDEVTQRTVALKLLERADPSIAALFEREYHFLASICHPSIIEVFDFGVDDHGHRYYTMELLSGPSLRELTPLPWARACGHLRDVATSLSLVHPKRLLHRDVTPNNVRLDSRGKAKLLDFGALAEFGTSLDVVGTPICIAPEIARGMMTDQRADLFSLGATAYFVLTGRRPFAADDLTDLETAWAVAPLAPSAIVPEIPSALDELVLSMLAIDQLSRPATAADVIERLGAIAGLDEEPFEAAANAHLGSYTLVGREAERSQVLRRLDDAAQGFGGTVLLSGEPGVGRSRLASEAILEARLRGFLTARADVLAHSGPGSVALALLHQLRDARPGTRVQAGAAALAPQSEAVSSAWVDDFVSASEERPVLVVVDDLHATDAPSLSFLLELSQNARSRRILLLGTVVEGTQVPPAVEVLQRTAVAIQLRELDARALEALVASIFGPVPHRARLVEWLIRIGGCNPSYCRSLLQHLVSRQVIRYAQGAWVLPPELDGTDVPSDVKAALNARLASLAPAARRLAEALALHRGAVSLALCERLVAEADRPNLLGSIESLIDEDLLVSSGAGYRFGQEVIRKFVVDQLGDEDRARLHLAIGRALASLHAELVGAAAAGKLQETETDLLNVVLDTGWHLLHGGDQEHGAALLKEAAIEISFRGQGSSAAVPALEAALRVYRARGQCRYDLANLILPLAVAALWTDWRLAYRYGDEALDIVLDVTGLARAERWARWIGPTLALMASLLVAALLYVFTARGRTARSFKEALATLAVMPALAAVYAILLDVDRAQQIPRRTRLLASLPKTSAGFVSHVYQRCTVEALAGGNLAEAQRLGAELERLLSKPNTIRGLREAVRKQLSVGLNATLGGINGLRVENATLANIQAIERTPLEGYRHNPDSLKARYHLARGEVALYTEHIERIDFYAALGGVSTWREDILMTRRLLGLHSFTGDLVSLKRLYQRLIPLAEERVSLACMRDAVHAAYLVARGELDAALRIFERLHETIDPKYGIIYSDNASAYPDALNRAGQHVRAKQVIREIRAPLQPEDLEHTFKYFDLELQDAFADACLGEGEAARARIAAAEREHSLHTNPLIRGRYHQIAARIAAVLLDATAFAKHLRGMEEWYRRTEDPALIAQHAQLAALGRQQFGLEVVSLQPPSALPGAVAAGLVSLARTPAERIQAVLEWVVAQTRARTGYLYLHSPQGLRYAAPINEVEPEANVRSALSVGLDQDCLAADELDCGTTADVLSTPEGGTQEGDAGTRSDCDGVFLSFPRDARRLAVGAIALIAGEERLVPIGLEMREALARALYEDMEIRAAYMERGAPIAPATGD